MQSTTNYIELRTPTLLVVVEKRLLTLSHRNGSKHPAQIQLWTREIHNLYFDSAWEWTTIPLLRRRTDTMLVLIRSWTPSPLQLMKFTMELWPQLPLLIPSPTSMHRDTRLQSDLTLDVGKTRSVTGLTIYSLLATAFVVAATECGCWHKVSWTQFWLHNWYCVS